MGLAPYGEPGSQQVKDFIRIIKSELLEIMEDGSLWLNQKYFNYASRIENGEREEMGQAFWF